MKPPAFALAQHPGTRSEQQDSAGVLLHHGLLAALADGMGGLSSGAEASSYAIAAFFETYSRKRLGLDVFASLQAALQSANQAVAKLSRRIRKESGTTFCAVAVEGNRLHWIWCGDSRIYLQRRENLECLTFDHTVERQLVESGLSPRVAQRHPFAARLTSYLGRSEIPNVGCSREPLELEKEDRILLCSDGVYQALPESELLLPRGESLQRGCDRIVARVLAQRKPLQDNATALGISVRSQALALRGTPSLG